MAACNVQRGNRQRRTRLKKEGRKGVGTGGQSSPEEKDHRALRRTGRGDAGLKARNTWSLYVSGGLGRTTGGEEGRDGGKKGKESRAHPPRSTPPSHNPLLLA